MAKKRKLQNYTNVAIGLLFVSFFLIFAIRPSVELIISLFKEQQEYTLLNTNLDKKITEIIQAQNSYARVIAYQDRINQSLPDENRLTDIKPLMSSQSASVESFAVLKTELMPLPMEKLTKMQIESKIKSDWTGVKSYLTSIRQQPRLFIVDSLSISRNEGTGSASLNAIIKLDSFIYKSP